MATLTPNYNLSKPESSDEFGDFLESYNDNMDIIDDNLGGGGGGSSTLSGLSDVNIDNPTDGQVLKYDSTNDEWYNDDESGGGSANIVELTQAEYDALPDTKLTDDTMYLIKDGESAEDKIPDELNDLSDVNISNPADGELLTYDSGEWVNTAPLFKVINGELCQVYDDGN